MENNPVKLLFNLSEFGLASLKHAIENGVIIAPDSKSEQRIDICVNCEQLDKEQVRCKRCGCFMNTKVRFDAAKCPDGKW